MPVFTQERTQWKVDKNGNLFRRKNEEWEWEFLDEIIKYFYLVELKWNGNFSAELNYKTKIKCNQTMSWELLGDRIGVFRLWTGLRHENLLWNQVMISEMKQ